MSKAPLGPVSSALVLALALSVGAQEAPSAPDEEGRGVVHQLPPSTDAFFATQQYTSMELLHLRRDGTFAGYDREHMFVAVSDEGRWRQTAAGSVELCSHYRFERIERGDLAVYLRAQEHAGLLPLADAIDERLAAIPGAGDLAPRQLRPVVVREWLSKDAFGPPPVGTLTPFVMSERDRVSRQDLRALSGALREYVAGRKGNLTSFVPRRFGDLVWLSDDDHPLESEVVRQYREHRDGPFLPGMLSVAVDAEAFAALLGTRQSFMHYPQMNVLIPRHALLSDFRRGRVAEPQCAGFEAGAAALPPPPTPAALPLPADEDVGFVEEGAEAKLLVLGSDGRFTRYTRLENETRQADAGEWRRGEGGLVRLCSHASAFRPIETDRLSLPIDRATYARLPGLLSALQGQLTAHPAQAVFEPEALGRVAARALEPDCPGRKVRPCRSVVSGDEPVPRGALLEFVGELDRYLRSGAANLQELRLFSLGSTAWLADPAGSSNAEVVRTLQAFGSGPCILAGVFVRVPMPALLALRGAVRANGATAGPEAAPLCAGFADAAR